MGAARDALVEWDEVASHCFRSPKSIRTGWCINDQLTMTYGVRVPFHPTFARISTAVVDESKYHHNLYPFNHNTSTYTSYGT